MKLIPSSRTTMKGLFIGAVCQVLITSIFAILTSPSPATAADGPAPLTGLTDPTLAVGLGPLNYWTFPYPFIDLMKVSRPWRARDDTGAKIKPKTLNALLLLDDSGWVRAMPTNIASYRKIFHWRDVKGTFPIADHSYVLLYKGKGDIRLQLGAKVTQRLPGRIEFHSGPKHTVVVKIVSIEPNDPVRDMVLIRKEHEALWRAGAVFNPDWLREIADVRQVRFMSWMRTNGSTQRRWSERPQISDATWGFENGAPVEIMVRLANEIGADPWFTIPHLADDDYIRRFATYVRDNLDPRLKVSAEYSNELWNGSFQQAKYIINQAEKGVFNGDPAEVAGRRAHHVAQIWADVFANEAPDRLIRVFGGFTNRLTWSHRALSAKPEGAGLLSSATVADGFDALAVTTYFGGSRRLREAAFTAWKARGGAATDDLTKLLNNPKMAGSVPSISARLRENANLAREHGLKLVSYEGGQHLHSIRSHRMGGEPFSSFFAAYVNSPPMAKAYEDMWRAWKDVGDGPFMHFTAFGRAGKSGSWGLQRYAGDDNPRALTLQRLNAVSPSWWTDRKGAVFQQGYLAGSQTTVGTSEEDYLLGGQNDETFYVFTGDDGVFGGDGYDAVRIVGTAASHEIIATGQGYTVNGPSGTKRLTEVEAIIFDNETIRLE